MAFDQPLEADRVDDLNLFSTFVRAPVIGTLMWILGGDQAKKEQEAERRQLERAMLEDTVVQASTMPPVKLSSRRSALKKAAPSLVGSEISDVGECSEALDGMHFIESAAHGTNSCPSLRSRKKTLSWSDESGRDLVEIIEHESSLRQERGTIGCEPMHGTNHSSMKRTNSVRSNANCIDRSQRDSRYLPNRLDRGHNPALRSFPFKSTIDQPQIGGIESPQWGWYVNTTPPSPEMYYTATTLPSKRNDSTADTVSSTSSSATESYAAGEATFPTNRVFQGLQEKQKAATKPIGWSSVPL